jgi:hypothetical protein
MSYRLEEYRNGEKEMVCSGTKSNQHGDIIIIIIQSPGDFPSIVHFPMVLVGSSFLKEEREQVH